MAEVGPYLLVWVEYVIYAVLLQLKLCHNLSIFFANPYPPIFKIVKPIVYSNFALKLQTNPLHF